MENEGYQKPQPNRGQPEQQGYYGWQYDQDATEIAPPRPSRLVLPSNSQVQNQQQAPYQPPRNRDVRQPQHISEQYQQPIQDMGTSLSFSLGTEYQYVDVPQPSQPMAQLRQERLQQLREERMRRQQRRMQPDVTTVFPWSKGKQQGIPQSPLPQSPQSFAPRTPEARQGAGPVSQAPGLSLPTRPSNDVAPVRTSTLRPDGLRLGQNPAVAQGTLSSAATPAQDTGMIQKVRIGRATRILAIAFVASRFLGLLRTSMFAGVFGTSTVSDAYLQAFLVPDLIFNIVAGGALSSAFIPVFTNHMIGENKDERTAWHIASSALNLALALMAVLATFAIIFAPQLVPLYNPGVTDKKQLDLITSLTRIMLLQSIVLGGGVIVTSVLNAQQDFKLPAIGTVLYNVGLIAGLLPGLFLALAGQRNVEFAVYAATWGVVIGAILQVGVQIPGLLKVGMHYTPVFDWKHPGVIQIGKQMLPRIFNSSMVYTSTFIDRALILTIGSFVGAVAANGAITQYYQALQLVLLPYGIFGLSVATAAFPTLAENVTKGRFDRVRNTILETLRSILLMTFPASVGLIVLGLPIIQAMLQHGAYSLDSAQKTAIPLAFFAVGLSSLAAIEILTRSFYAMRDTKTAVMVSVGQFVFKIALSVIFVNIFGRFGADWGIGSLALATSIANILEVVVLYWILHNRIGDMQVKSICTFAAKVLLASLAMGLSLLVARFILDFLLNTTTEPSLGFGGKVLVLIKLAIELVIGLFVYVRSMRFLGIEELGPLKRILDRLKLSWI